MRWRISVACASGPAATAFLHRQRAGRPGGCHAGLTSDTASRACGRGGVISARWSNPAPCLPDARLIRPPNQRGVVGRTRLLKTAQLFQL
jgi:hypothetical protein